MILFLNSMTCIEILRVTLSTYNIINRFRNSENYVLTPCFIIKNFFLVSEKQLSN